MEEMEDLNAWIGRREIRRDVIAPFPARAMAATLNRAQADFGVSEPLPHLWHWLYFLPVFAMRETNYDGHAALGGFLPPVPLPRRMWAGGRLTFHAPIRIGQSCEKRSTISDVSTKTGRTGSLVFVTVRHEVYDTGTLCLSEEHDIVYRSPADTSATGRPPRAAPDTSWASQTVHPDPVLLFRYSALTFNGHRIHYDQPFCAEEGYDGLVVHGPLMATCLMELLCTHVAPSRVTGFSFRALAPVTGTPPFSTHLARPADGGAALWIRRADGGLAMQAHATYAQNASR